MKAEGTQVLAEYHSCAFSHIKDEKWVEEALRTELVNHGFTVVDCLSKVFDPIGLTFLAILEQSHVSVHTYPEAHHVSLDIFHCDTDIQSCVDFARALESKFQSQFIQLMETRRGHRMNLLQRNAVNSVARPGFSSDYIIRKEVFRTQSKYQSILIIDNDAFGRMLFLDGEPQLASTDSHIYNRALVDPFHLVPRRNRVAILGGGDGAVLHEVLKWNVDEVYLVDFDEAVIEASKKYLRSVCYGAFEDPRVTVKVTDAREFLSGINNLDAIFYDITLHPEPATVLSRGQFLEELFQEAQRALNPGGLWSMQGCSDHDWDARNVLQSYLPKYFSRVTFERVFIPSLCGPWLFASGLNELPDAFAS